MGPHARASRATGGAGRCRGGLTRRGGGRRRRRHHHAGDAGRSFWTSSPSPRSAPPSWRSGRWWKRTAIRRASSSGTRRRTCVSSPRRAWLRASTCGRPGLPGHGSKSRLGRARPTWTTPQWSPRSSARGRALPWKAEQASETCISGDVVCSHLRDLNPVAHMILALVADRTAPAELRSRLAYDEPTQRRLLDADRPGVGEMAILCTCHRTEVYFTSLGAASEAVHGVAGLLPGIRPTDVADLQMMEGMEAVEHLFRVTCGLDSRVVGDPQVLGQVRRACVRARDLG